MEEDEVVKRTGAERSPRFPFIPLEKALERANQFYEHERRGAAPYEAAVQHWGYSQTSSGAMQTLAALKNYGLLDGPRNGLRLTELALRIILDRRPDSAERLTFMRQASLTPVIAAEVQSRWPDGLPSDATLNHYLVLDRGFNEATARKAIEIIKQNQLLTESSESYGISPSEKTKGDGDMVQRTAEIGGRATGISPAPVPKNGTQPPSAQTVVDRVTAPSGVTIELRFSGVPTKSVYAFLKAYSDFMGNQLPAERSGNEEPGNS